MQQESSQNGWTQYAWRHHARAVYTVYHDTTRGPEQQSAANNLFLNRKIGFSSDSLTSITNIIASTDIIGLLPKIIYEQNA